ncbi:uncharacterized protein EI90DRAFT_1763533 [Cantharellus anzutake]|uniref:uncharacterized protein n=1 Tax=Cantharellus anzutake TaxID=1750568 RepID=UPI001904D166|nr:uncharacterized protein EI90DRAFT_1763533 [Cantharellus anzutake]KAF8341653.1 hypothetical protein EI90DRAFT_1763533 [Cantharellus anzutake]
MPSDPKSHRFSSWLKEPRHPSELPDDGSQVSTPPASNNQIIEPTTAHDRTNDKDHGSPEGLHYGALTTTTPTVLLPGSALQDNTTEQQTSFRDKLLRPFRRSPRPCPSPAPSRRNQSSTFQSKCPMPTAPVQTSTNDSLSPTKMNTEFPRAMGNSLATGNDDPSVHTQQEPESSVPAISSVPAESVPRRSDGDLKKMMIGTTKLLLEATAIGLKSAPIANLDQIPNTLLRWIQIYEVC